MYNFNQKKNPNNKKKRWSNLGKGKEFNDMNYVMDKQPFPCLKWWKNEVKTKQEKN